MFSRASGVLTPFDTEVELLCALHERRRIPRGEDPVVSAPSPSAGATKWRLPSSQSVHRVDSCVVRFAVSHRECHDWNFFFYEEPHHSPCVRVKVCVHVCVCVCARMSIANLREFSN